MKINNIAKSAMMMALLAVAGAAGAHGVWVGKVHGHQSVGYGHGGTDMDEYDPAKVVKATAFNTKGDTVPVKIEAKGDHVDLSYDKAAIIAVTFDNGYWAQDADGKWVNKKGDQVKGAKSSSRIYKFTTHYANDRVKPKAVGTELEVVPDVNPSTLKQGENLGVTVLLNGKPVEGALVDSNMFDSGDNQEFKTDKNGKVQFPVQASGFNIIEAELDVDTPSDKFDGKSYTATLTFDSKQEHHHH